MDAIDFEYVFDDKKNWIEQTKSINGKKLYVWKREIKYFDKNVSQHTFGAIANFVVNSRSRFARNFIFNRK